MTIPLTGANSLFVRLGHLGGILNRINTDRGDPSTGVPAKIVTLEADYPSNNNPQLLDSINSYLSSWQGQSLGFLSQLAQIAANTVITMADNDVILTSKDIVTALGVLISQMNGASATVNKPTVSAVVTAGGSNNGDAQVVASVKNTSGAQLDYAFNENLDLTCTTDSQTTATLDKEPVSIAGDAAQSNQLDFTWPKGSGTSLTMAAVSANDSQSSSTNLLNNSNFETFTSNVPNQWAVLVGSGGTTIFQSSGGNAYAGSAALQFTGNGSELTSIAQTFNNSGGTTAKLLPLTQYAFNCWVKVSAVPAAGVLAIELVDGSNTVINDAAGTANSATKSLPGATTSYVAFNGTFRTPAVLPATQNLRVRLSTALDNTKSVFVDHLSLVPMTQLYSGGIYLSIHSGASKLIAGDAYTVAVTNNYGGAFQKLFERFFSMRANGLMLPSSGAPTISDGLVT